MPNYFDHTILGNHGEIDINTQNQFKVLSSQHWLTRTAKNINVEYIGNDTIASHNSVENELIPELP